MTFDIRKYDTLLAWTGTLLFLAFLLVLSTRQGLDFDASYNMLSYQNLFDGKGFTYTYNGAKIFFDPVISTGPELYGPAYLLWLLMGKTDYFVATYVLIGYYAVFFLFLIHYVFKKTSLKAAAVFSTILLLLCTSQLFREFVLLNPKGEPVAAILSFMGLYLLKERRHPLLASLILGLALDVKPNIIVALVPSAAILFLLEFVLPALRRRSWAAAAKKSVFAAFCFLVILTPNLVSSKLVPYLTLEPEQFQSVREQRQMRSETMIEKGFGQILLLAPGGKETNLVRFKTLLAEKLAALKTSFAGSTLLSLCFLLFLPIFTVIAFRHDHFSFYLLLYAIFFFFWWLLCPIDSWYRYFSIVDFMTIFALVSLLPVMVGSRQTTSSLVWGVLVAVLFLPRFSFAAIEKHFTFAHENRQSLMRMAGEIDSLDEEQIFTYGWFQAPQLMFLTHKRFYDFRDKEKMALARLKYDTLYFLATIENTLIRDQMDELYNNKLEVVYADGYNSLSKISIHPKSSHTVDFTRGYDLLIKDGWYDEEGATQARYRWTRQEFSMLIPAGTVAVRFSVRIPAEAEPEGGKRIQLLQGGEVMAAAPLPPEREVWTTFRLELPRPPRKEEYGLFRLNYYFCPGEQGPSRDRRKLGIAVKRAVFSKE